MISTLPEVTLVTLVSVLSPILFFCLPPSSCWSLSVPAFVTPSRREEAFNQVEIPAVQPPSPASHQTPQ